MVKTRKVVLPALVIAASIGGATCVQAQDEHSMSIERQLLVCDAVADLSQRLVCFDSVVDNLELDQTATETTKLTESPVVVKEGLATAGVAVTPEIATVTVSEAPVVAADEDPGEEDLSGTATIVRVWQNLDGRFSVELDNGQVWRETEGSRVGMPKAGSAVEISTAALGSYQMKIDGIARKARVRRTN